MSYSLYFLVGIDVNNTVEIERPGPEDAVPSGDIGSKPE